MDWTAAIASCADAVEATHDPRYALDAARAAYALRRNDDLQRFAERALAGSPTDRIAGDAHFYRGAAEFRREHYEAATRELAAAVTLHKRVGNAAGEASDDQLLSGAWLWRGEYERALEADDANRDAASRAGDPASMVFADLGRTNILREMGLLGDAEQAVDRALAETTGPEDRALALIERGILRIEQRHPALAREPLTEALRLELTTAHPRARYLASIHWNLAVVERKAGEFAVARAEVEQAHQLDHDDQTYYAQRGMVLADQGELVGAASDFAAAEALHPDGAWAWWVPMQRARLAARSADPAAAIAADRRAIEQVARLAAGAGALAPTVVANHREPYLHLIGLLAARQRWLEVLGVIAELDGRALLDSRESASEPSPSSPAIPAHPAGPAPPLAPDAARRAVVAWRGRRLVIVVPGGDRVWRIDVHDGQVSGRDAGDADALAELARVLETHPDDLAAAQALGAAMLPPSLPPRPAIAVLAIGPLARAPLGGLQIDGHPAFTRNALVRAPGLLPRTPPVRRDRPAIVIGDPSGDLPAAADEARRVAAGLSVAAQIGGAATRAQFRRAAGADVLHIAAHTHEHRTGASLDLADGPITLAEIAALRPAPRLVVLASCGAAAGRDDAGNGSLTTAFLEAGADAVVGTRWSVNDADAARLVAAFYARGGARDPERAIAGVELDAALSISTRAAFELFVARPPR